MNEVDLAKIAAGLSECMKSMLARARSLNLNEPPRCFGPANTKAALRDRGLGYGDFVYLTPLGEQVRNHLKESSNER